MQKSNSSTNVPKTENVIPEALKNFDSLPDLAQVRVSVCEKLLGVSRATIYRLVKAERLKAYKLTSRTTTFNVGELKKFINSEGGK